jgi:hypothetical protein
MVAYACNPSTQEAKQKDTEIEAILEYTASWRSAWAQSKTLLLCKNKKQKESK